MKKKGRVRRFFPGVNSAYGFYSFYDQLYGPDFEQVFILKGGPGTGKSSLMAMISEAMLAVGFDVEQHYCSAAPHCLDAVVVPAAGVALLDGTAPHVVDPRYPGALEEVVNLGAFWERERLVRHKGAICRLVDEIGELYRRAYTCLFAAKSYREATDSYYAGGNHEYFAALEQFALELVEEIFGGWHTNRKRKKTPLRKLFASAISAPGTINHLENLLEPVSLVFVLRGEDGTGKKRIMGKVAQAALLRGYDVEAFPCALDPRQIDHLFIPELEVALVNSMEPHCPEVPQPYRELDAERFAAKFSDGVARERNTFLEQYRLALRQAVAFLRRANEEHDLLESYYLPAMRFTRIEKLGEELLAEILDRAQRARKNFNGEN